MLEWIDEMIEESYKTLIECVKRDELDNASKIQEVIDDLKKRREEILKATE